MMGSGSAVQHRDALASLLAIVRSPDALAKNIEALDAKITSAEDAVRIAREEQAKAREAVENYGSLLSQLKDREEAVQSAEAVHATNILRLEDDRRRYLDDVEKLAERIKAHDASVAAVKSREDAIVSKEMTISANAQAASAVADKRQAMLDVREDAIANRESAVFAREAELKARIEKMKKLAE